MARGKRTVVLTGVLLALLVGIGFVVQPSRDATDLDARSFERPDRAEDSADADADPEADSSGLALTASSSTTVPLVATTTAPPSTPAASRIGAPGSASSGPPPTFRIAPEARRGHTGLILIEARNARAHFVNADGSQRRDIGFSGALAMSPDGTKILFETYNRGLVVLEVESGVARNLRPAISGGASYSPDGARIAYVDRQPTTSCIAVTNADGSDARCLILSAGGERPRWSPDGTRIFYVGPDDANPGRSALLSIDANTGGDKRAVIADVDGAFDVSATGEIAFSRPSGGDQPVPDLWLAAYDGSNQRNLTNGQRSAARPAFSPDGERVAFTTANASMAVARLDGAIEYVVADASPIDW